MMYSTILERFIRYARFNTRSNPANKHMIPSSPEQVEFALKLENELNLLGLEEVFYDERDGFVTAKVSSNQPDEDIPAIGFMAHIDTADFPSENVNPQVHYNYDGNDVVLNKELDIVMTVKEFPNLKDYVGETLVTTDGTTLLGADCKAGMASIVEVMKHLIENPEIPHGDIWVAFGPDEEIGIGASRFIGEKWPVEFAYTIDGGRTGQLDYETFNAAQAVLTFTGTSVHPGAAKDVMVNPLAEAAKFYQKIPANETPETTSGYEGYYMLGGQTGDLNSVTAIYNIRDHDFDKFEERKAQIKKWVDEQNATYAYPRISCVITNQYANMGNIIKNDSRSFDLAKQAYAAVGVTPRINPMRGGTDGSHLAFKGIATPNLFKGSENSHGQYEFVTVERMKLASDVILSIIELVQDQPVVYHI